MLLNNAIKLFQYTVNFIKFRILNNHFNKKNFFEIQRNFSITHAHLYIPVPVNYKKYLKIKKKYM